MRRILLATVAFVGIVSVMLSSHGRTLAQAVHEPTIDERFRDENVKPTNAEMPRLDPPQNSQESRLTHSKPAIVKNKAAAYLGVTFDSNQPEAIVRTVAPGSPAEQAGLKPNDFIETLQGRRIRTNDDVLDIVSKMRPGDVLDIGVVRQMNIHTRAPLAAVPATTERSVGYPPDLPTSNEAAPEAPQDVKQKAPQSGANATPKSRNDSQKSNQSDDNRRLLGRGLRSR